MDQKNKKKIPSMPLKAYPATTDYEAGKENE